MRELTIATYGAWCPGLEDHLRWLMAAPAVSRHRERIEFGGVWYSRVLLELAANATRPALRLAVVATPGTHWSDACEQHVLAQADGVVFVVVNNQSRWGAIADTRDKLRATTADRRGALPCVIAREDPGYTVEAEWRPGEPSRDVPVEPVDIAALGLAAPVFDTYGRDGRGLGACYRALLARLL